MSIEVFDEVNAKAKYVEILEADNLQLRDSIAYLRGVNGEKEWLGKKGVDGGKDDDATDYRGGHGKTFALMNFSSSSKDNIGSDTTFEGSGLKSNNGAAVGASTDTFASKNANKLIEKLVEENRNLNIMLKMKAAAEVEGGKGTIVNLDTTNISRKDSNESRNTVGGMVKTGLRVSQVDFDVDSETPGNGEATEQDTGIYYSLRGTPRETPKGTPR